MLRVASSLCFKTVPALKSELRIVNCCVAPSLTSCHQIAKPIHHYSLKRNMTTSNRKDSEEPVIYRGKLERPIIRVKLFSLTTSVLGLVFQPILYSQASSLPVLIATCSVAGFFTFVTPLLLHQLAKRYVNKITYNKEKDLYVAHLRTFFLREKKLLIEPGEAKIPTHGGMFTSVEVRGIPLMVEVDGFDKQHLIRLMGYDKPIDIEHERIAGYMRDAEQRIAEVELVKKKNTHSGESDEVSSEGAVEKRRTSNRSS